eukprot:CAMPEP_0197241170 /NCGR_PEP_ID=MMETSP1429-20130617/7277_1 /TAXON_ID=49237 /ORGANISM="Chaetoceros  sp., Strain UNC1202" /LENGTH=399 /DNA_ID=CAMNT_0042700963 /DNA_START=13 /DNA_END=1212 /DNA_ORIENTATION=+
MTSPPRRVHALPPPLLQLIFLILCSTTRSNAQKALLFGSSGAVGSEVLRGLVRNSFWEEIILVGRTGTAFPSPKVTKVLSEEGVVVDAQDYVHDDDDDDDVTDNDDDNDNDTTSVTPDHPNSNTTRRPHITHVQLPDLTNMHQNESLPLPLTNLQADACFIAIGVGSPHKLSLKSWHMIEIDMISSIAHYCTNSIQVRYVALLSAVDAEDHPEPFTEDELEGGKGDEEERPLGWWNMLKYYARMKGLEDRAVTLACSSRDHTTTASSSTTASSNIPSIHLRLFQPSSIITEEERYGWVDWTLFRLHKVLDPILPTKYHSVKVGLLGMAMAEDAVDILTNGDGVDSGDDADSTSHGPTENLSGGETSPPRVTQLSYDHYVRIAGSEFERKKEDTDSRVEL